MASSPTVSVIMPAFNTDRFIGDAIASVVAQSHAAWELLVVDDGSSDETGRIADEWAARDAPGRIKVIHQSNGGIAAARNRALEHVNPASEFISFLDSDDVWWPEALALMLGALQTTPTAVGVHGLRTYIDREGRHISVNGAAAAPIRRRAVGRGLRTITPDAPTTFAVLAYGCCVFTGALLVRSAAVRQAGRFDSGAVPAEDWDMWLRLSLIGPFTFIREPLYGYRLHGTNSTANAVTKNNSLYYVRRKFAFDSGLPASVRATVMSGFRWYELYRAAVCLRQLTGRARRGLVRDTSALALDGLRHLVTSMAPGRRRLAALGDRSLSPGQTR